MTKLSISYNHFKENEIGKILNGQLTVQKVLSLKIKHLKKILKIKVKRNYTRKKSSKLLFLW